MTSKKQILLAFLIPFLPAISLAVFKNYYFTHGCVPSAEIPGSLVCSQISKFEIGCILLIIILFIISVILPPFITSRTYQKTLNRLKMKQSLNKWR
jgi:hypothetical protein